VVDTTAPVIDAAADASAEATGPDGAAVTFASPATHDAVDGDGVATCAPASGSTFALGDTTVTCAAMDAAGNAATDVSFTVSVVDTTAPLLALPADIALPATSADGAVVTFSASAQDIVDGDVAVDCAPASGSVFPRGETTVECIATDAAGNAATGAFAVRVETSVGATVATAQQTYGQLDAVLGGVRGTVHVEFPGGAPASGASVTVTITRLGSLVGLFETQTVSGTTDANGDFAFSADVPFELLGEYRLDATIDWMGIPATATGGYAVAPLPSDLSRVADALPETMLLP
jgi:hypothetical protein